MEHWNDVRVVHNYLGLFYSKYSEIVGIAVVDEEGYGLV